MSEKAVFRWACLAVVAAALAGLLWMLNDMRLQVRELAQSADKQIDEVQVLTAKANTILTQTERVTNQLDDKVPKILTQAERVTGSMEQHLPKILAETESAVGSIANLGANFRQYKDLMAAVHAKRQDTKLLDYANKLLDMVGGRPNAVVGMKKPGTDQLLKQAVPAKQWAGAAREDAKFLSLSAADKAHMLRGLTRADADMPLYIRLGEQEAPRLLSDWLQEVQPGGKD